MLAFARETRLSETTFVQAGGDGADYRNRIFTTLREIPFAGHPSLGTAVAVARAAGHDRARFVQRTGAGLQPVDVARVEGERWRASMLQEPPEHGPELDPAEGMAALGLPASEAHPAWPPQVVSTGIPHVMLPLARAEALEHCRPDLGRLQAITAATGAVVLYAFALDEDGHPLIRGFFEDPMGVIEDPATGSAVGPLCAYLAERAGLRAIRARQGVHMGRPALLEAELAADRVRVSGDVVVMFDGVLAG